MRRTWNELKEWAGTLMMNKHLKDLHALVDMEQSVAGTGEKFISTIHHDQRDQEWIRKASIYSSIPADATPE